MYLPIPGQARRGEDHRLIFRRGPFGNKALALWSDGLPVDLVQQPHVAVMAMFQALAHGEIVARGFVAEAAFIAPPRDCLAAVSDASRCGTGG